MKKLWLLVIVLLVVSCNKQRTSYDEYNLKGRVWKIQETSYEGIEKDGEYELGENVLSGYYQYVFNEYGNLVEYSDHFEDGDIYTITRYYYNDDNICTKVIAYEDEDEDEDYIQWKQISRIENSKIVEWEIFNEDNEIVRKTSLRYDGNLISAVEHEITDDENGYKISYENDYKKGQLYRQTTYDYKGEISDISTFKRNSNKDIIAKSYYNPKDSTEEIYKSIYEYDDNGNWTKQYNLDDEGEIDVIVVREYEYYGKTKRSNKAGEITGIWFVIETDDDWFDEDDWLVIEANNIFDIGYDEEVWMSGTWEIDKKQKLFTLRSSDEDDSKKYKYEFIDSQLTLSTLIGEVIVRFEKR